MSYVRFFSRLFTARVEAPQAGRPAPAEPICVIGDIHGSARALERLLAALPRKHGRLVFVGDLIDRGEESAEVLAQVRALCGKGAVCLMGNHERMMLDFLEDPAGKGKRWLKFGGLQTLASFGVGGLTETASGEALERAARDLRAALGPEGVDFVASLPLVWTSGNVAVVHAAAHPGRPIDAQRPAHLLWGHPEFGQAPRQDGLWVVHGHTIVDEAHEGDGVISVDTGAYGTGRLSAALIGTDGSVRFVTS